MFSGDPCSRGVTKLYPVYSIVTPLMGVGVNVGVLYSHDRQTNDRRRRITITGLIDEKVICDSVMRLIYSTGWPKGPVVNLDLEKR